MKYQIIQRWLSKRSAFALSLLKGRSQRNNWQRLMAGGSASVSWSKSDSYRSDSYRTPATADRLCYCHTQLTQSFPIFRS